MVYILLEKSNLCRSLSLYFHNYWEGIDRNGAFFEMSNVAQN